ncbi:MAG: US12 family protein [Planctomycetes bacterium]|nr:US12 family protein [Planctomycetota bacterium]
MTSYVEPTYRYLDEPAIRAVASERATFIRRTYAHVAGALGALAILDAILLSLPVTQRLVETMLTGRFTWLIVLGLFMAVSWVAEKWARSEVSVGQQYLGLGLYVVAQAVILLPLLYIATTFFPGQNLIATAGVVTGAVFAGLTGVVLLTRKDFSFLGGFLSVASFAALGIIVASVLFGFSLGIFFMGAMVAFAGLAIVYQTSNIMHHYRTTQHVAAALALFASVVLLFWYVLQLLISLNSNRD